MSLLEDFIFATDSLVKFHASAKAISEQSQTLATLEVRSAKLRDLWLEEKAKYAVCIRYKPSKTDDSLDIDVIEAKYKNSTETYVACLAFFMEIQEKLKPNSQSVKEPLSPVPNSQQPSSSHCLKLPPCDTDVFHGDYLSWPAFRDMFDAVYIKHPKLGEVEKLFHLRAKTKGDAYRTVSHFPLTNASFSLAWEALRAAYENTRILVNNQVRNLFNLPAVHDESAKLIRSLQSTINDSTAALQAQSVQTEHWDPILVFAVSSKLPKTTLAIE